MASSPRVDTASAIRSESITGVHLFKIFGYSLTKATGTKLFRSEVFTIGGYQWVILYHPDGEVGSEAHGFLSFYLELKSAISNVKARYTFTILEQDGAPSDMTMMSAICTFRSTASTSPSPSWGCRQFAKVTDFEASKCLKDDAFTLKCTVTVVKDTKLEAISHYGVAVPPSNLTQNLTKLLESGEGADVTFVVNGDSFKAHRWMLAARSAVFKAQLFGEMKEKCTDAIMVDGIEAPVFKSMLCFIYSDLVPDFEGTSDADSEKQDMGLMAQHLLVAADRYALERLKLMCEDVLCKKLSVKNVVTALILAEQHNCSQLKAQCFRFMSYREVFKEVALTPEFHNLLKIYPSILIDIKAVNLN